MRVLYATDGSFPSREGERLITSLFDPRKVEVEAFAVTSPESGYLPDSPDIRYAVDHMDLPPLGAGEVAHEAAEHLSDAGFTASHSSGRGSAPVEIVRLLRETPFDLVVLGAGHSTWLGNALLGSVSTHVLHHSPCSVLVAHRAPVGSGRVLIGIDGSGSALLGARLATRLLDPDKVSLSLVTVVPRPWLSIAVYPPGPPFGSYSEYRELQNERIEAAWAMVERVGEDLKGTGFDVDVGILSGSAGSQLLKESENLTADLVVLGSRGLGAFKRALIGSTSDQVVRHAPATLVGRSRSASEVLEKAAS